MPVPNSGALRLLHGDGCLPLNVGSLANRPSGRIRINDGAGCGRFIRGTVWNEGTFEANTSVSFLGNDSLFRNTGVFEAGHHFRLLKSVSLDGWFSDIRLPALRPGLNWQVHRTTNGIDLIAGELQPGRGKYVVSQGVAYLEVSSRLARRIRVEVSSDLENWAPLLERTPFLAYTQLPVPEVPLSAPVYFFRTTLDD